MIERIPDQIPVQTGEWRGTTFDIIPKETFAMACRKINELVDAFNIFDPEEIGNQFHALSVAIKRLTERIEKLEKEHIADTSKKIKQKE